MIFAGVGCRKGVKSAEIIDAVDAALGDHRRDRKELGGLATGAAKRDEAAIPVAAAILGLPLTYVGEVALGEVDALVVTRSERSTKETGSASLSEASALAAAGAGAILLGPRTVSGSVTCALAETAS